MAEIWARVLKEQKIIADILHKSKESDLEKITREVCEKADIPAPLVLDKHKRQYSKFSLTKFLTAEFVESVDFDCLVIENVTGRENNKKLK
jgi:hypothetical protein